MRHDHRSRSRSAPVLAAIACLLPLLLAGCAKQTPAPKTKPCVACAGTGLIKLEGMTEAKPCEACNGTGIER
jgi:DnaJ-class molecular chaperone